MSEKISRRAALAAAAGGAGAVGLFVSAPQAHAAGVTATEVFNVKDFGAKGDAVAIDTPAINEAMAAAETAGGGTVGFPPGVYRADNLVVPPGVYLLGMPGPAAASFGFLIGEGLMMRRSSVVIRRSDSSSANPLIDIKGAASGVGNITFQGYDTSTASLVVNSGFETNIQNMWITQSGGIGFEVQRANNTNWQNIHVLRSGTTALPAVKIWSDSRIIASGETNTVDIDGLTIEECSNVHLNIAWNGSATSGNPASTEHWAEFIRIRNLHIESSERNIGGQSGNVDPVILVGNVRTVIFDDAFVYGGPGFLLRHHQNTVRTWGNGGIILKGGQWLGSDPENVSATPHLFDLVRGDGFVMTAGVRSHRYTSHLAKVAFNYGGSVFIGPDSQLFSNNVIDDSRATLTDWNFRGHVVANGLFIARATGVPTMSPSANILPDAMAPGSNSSRGRFTFGTGTSSFGGGKFMDITFTKPYPGNQPPFVTLTPTTPAAAALTGVYTGSLSPNAFNIIGPALPANQPAGTYGWNYVILG